MRYALALMGLLAITFLTGMGKTEYEWRTLYLPHYNEQYTPSDEPVLPLAHAKEDRERSFRVCAYVVGDGELLINYGDAGEGVLFSFEQPSPVCAYANVGAGGGGLHANPLDLYLFQRGEREVRMWRPEIKVGEVR